MKSNCQRMTSPEGREGWKAPGATRMGERIDMALAGKQ